MAGGMNGCVSLTHDVLGFIHLNLLWSHLMLNLRFYLQKGVILSDTNPHFKIFKSAILELPLD